MLSDHRLQRGLLGYLHVCYFGGKTSSGFPFRYLPFPKRCRPLRLQRKQVSLRRCGSDILLCPLLFEEGCPDRLRIGTGWLWYGHIISVCLCMSPCRSDYIFSHTLRCGSLAYSRYGVPINDEVPSVLSPCGEFHRYSQINLL